MAHSTRAAETLKPRKPSDAFPLTPREDGRWCKRYKTVHGQWKTFYARGTAQEALDEWNHQKDDLLAGREPRDQGRGATVRDASNAFLAAKRAAVDAGTINARTFIGYNKTTDTLVASLGLTRPIADLRPDDFSKLYRSLAKKHGVATLGREITIIRGVFKFAVESDLIDRAVKFGPEFKAPSKEDKRKQRNKNKREHGARMFAADELKRMIDKAGPQLRAMILLGINGGLGNTDCALLHLSHLDLEGGWLDYPRPKTEVERRVPLWPETVKAIEVVLANRREPTDEMHKGLVFLTRLGQPWVRYELTETKTEDGKTKVTAKSDDAIAKAIAKMLKDDLGIYRPGVTFYALRHTFETVAGGCQDQVAVDAVMGHVDDSMAAEYREQIDDNRLRAAVNHVHAWLYAKAVKSTGAKRVPTAKAATNPRKSSGAGSAAMRGNGELQLRVVG